jgi:aldose 1-epimerase
VDTFTLENNKGYEARIASYGGALVSLFLPDRDGKLDDVVLGFDSLDDYKKPHPYFGALIGRFSNRIANGRFSLNGTEYQLARNDGPNHLHGGNTGFDKVEWSPNPLTTEEGPALELNYTSADGEEGYPGKLSVRVVYTLSHAGDLRIDYLASADRDTIVNLTNHAYFNLAGAGDVLDHRVTLDAKRFTPVDRTLIPTGELALVAGTALDFTSPTAIGARIDADDEQLHLAGGYDHNFVLEHEPGVLGRAARVAEPKSGRVMEVWTTEPGIQFYSGNFLDGSLVGKRGVRYERRFGFCLEAQHFPDSPNKPGFPSVVLRADQTYTQTTLYRFMLE